MGPDLLCFLTSHLHKKDESWPLKPLLNRSFWTVLGVLGFFMIKTVGKMLGLIFTYIFSITNVLQGIILFVVHCLLNCQVRIKYEKWLSGMRKGTKLESTNNSRFTTHIKMEKNRKSWKWKNNHILCQSNYSPKSITSLLYGKQTKTNESVKKVVLRSPMVQTNTTLYLYGKNE